MRRGFPDFPARAYCPPFRASPLPLPEEPLEFSQNLRGVDASATLALTALARELRAAGRDIIDLCAGEPDFPTPSAIAEAGIASIRQGRTHYTPVAGTIELRRAIASAYSRPDRAPIDPASVVVTAGAKQALFNACFTLFGPGDRVLVPVPYWTSYPAIVRLARAEPVDVPTRSESDFRASPADLDRVSDERTRGLILNSPSNPTGSVYSIDELREILDWAARHEVWVISDEIYDRICYTAPRAPGVLDLDPGLLERVVIVNGASKVFAMTGWRLGFSIAPTPVAARMAALQSHTTSNASAPAQYAALAAYSGSDAAAAEVDSMLERFRSRRELVLTRFGQKLPGVGYVEPQGAFYLFFEVERFTGRKGGSEEFCQRALHEAGVALVPGSAFGADSHTRLSFAAAEHVLEDAIDRLARMLT